MEPIAVIGLAHRFPGGASTPAKLWEVLTSGRDLSREPPADRLNLAKFYDPNGEKHGSSNVTRSYFLSEDPRLFDTSFFNVSPLEAEAMDPQQRLLLETVYEAAESAGAGLDSLRGSRTSVFVGVMTGDYEAIQYRDTEDLSHYTASGTSRAILANRISYFFDLAGSSVCLDTACSSSLVALHLAVQDLRSGAADAAVVAGTNLIFAPDMYVSESKLRMLSPTGKCRMWDALADGYARGEGTAALMLKPLSKALRDGDPIRGVIRNSGVNSDGRTPGITMPSASAQARLTTETYRAAGLDPSNPEDRCQYFEAHGTGTQAGDPTEARGIFESFFPTQTPQTTDQEPLLVGSIKTVVGHLEGCAGLAGVIKVLLAMEHDTIPPNLHLKSLNPKIEPFRKILRVPTEPTPWPARAPGRPKRASVNSFGFGGTNAHVILESYDDQRKIGPPPEENTVPPIVVSAHSQSSLLENIQKLARYLHDHPEVDLRDVSWTLWTRRSGLALRKAFAATSRKQLLFDLEQAIADSVGSRTPSLGTPLSPLVSPTEGFGALGIFTGQGAQWPGMGRELLLRSPIFKKAIEECDKSLASLPDAPSWSLEKELLASAGDSRISEAEIAQPATTAVEICLARMLQASGVKFTAVVGHSSGEIAALFAAGILSLSDAIRVAFYRGLYAKLAGAGSMMAVGIGGDAALDFCQEDRFRGRICLAAKNSPSSVTLSGDVDSINEAKAVFDERKIFARVLRTDKAYHSRHMEACSEAYLQAMRKCGIKPLEPTGTCVWVSSVNGTADRYWDRDFDDLAGPYWIANMVKPVLFADAVTTALTNGGPFDAAIEVGPHPALKGPVNQTVRPHLGKPLPYCGSMSRDDDCVASFSELRGFLWTNFGPAALDYDGCQRCWTSDAPAPRVVPDLPTYSWDHGAPIWRESRLSRTHRLRGRGNASILLGHRCPDDSDWEPRWRNFLSLKELPWLRGHSFQGEVLFPSAGYVAMMLEVAQFLAGDRPMSLIEIDDLTLERPLKVEEGPRPVEMLTSVRVTNQGGDKITAEFSSYVCSDPAKGAVDRTCYGSISVLLGEPGDNLLPSRVDPLSGTVPSVDVERFYGSVRDTRLEYEDLFKRLNSLRRVDGIATATASWFADEIEYGDLYHPALIDVALQPVFAAFNAPTAERLWTAYLPQSFSKITVNPSRKLAPSAGGQIEILIDAFSTELSATKISGDVSIYAPDDDFHTPFLQLEGMTLAALGRPDASNDRVIFAETTWKPDLLGGAEFPVDYDPPQDSAVEEAERVALFFCRKLLSEAAAVGIDNLKPHEKLMVSQLSTLATSVEKPSHRAAWKHDTREAVDEILARNTEQVDFDLLRTVGDSASSVFRNEKQMVHVLFADDKLSRFYRQGLGLRNAQRQVAAYMRAISHRYPKAKILELGAGTGATTSAVFDSIGGRFGSYTFTDVSLAFFPEAQARFAEHVHKMAFRKLDIGRAFEEQGFDGPGCDVVIAANVLHVSDDIGAVLRRARGLLRPGGFLVVTEPTSDHLQIQVIMGGLEGWWLAQDGCRRFGPVASVETWDEKLRGAGFTGVDLLGRDQREEELHTFSTFVSQAADDTIHALREPLDFPEIIPDTTQFAIIGGSTLATSKMVRSIRDRLSSYGEMVHFPDIRSIKPSALPSSVFVLCLAELDQPSFKAGVDEALLTGLQALFDKTKGALVATKNTGSSNSFSNMLIGLCRGLRAEKPGIASSLQVIDLDGNTKPDPNTLLRHFLRLVITTLHVSGSEDRLWSLETELMLRDGEVFIPRIDEYAGPNERTNSARRQILKDVTTDTHIIEVVSADGKPELKASSKIISPRADLETIDVKVSLLNPISILPYQEPQYLCLGIPQGKTETVLALSSSNASVIQVPSTQILPIDERKLDATGLGLVALTLAAQAWIRAVPRGHSIWFHGVDDSIIAVLESVAERSGVRAFVTSSDPGHTSYISPSAPTRILRTIVPPKTAAVIFGTSVAKEASEELLARTKSIITVRNPLSGEFFNCPTSWSSTPASSLLEEAYTSSLTMSLTTATETLSIETLSEAPPTTALTVLAWPAQTTRIPAALQPVNPNHLFNPDKTYLMVGLTGDVGISICTWMIKHGGVRHVVLASRNPQVSPSWIESMSRLGATVRVEAMDVTDPDRIRAVVDHISKTMPPIAGVCNGSMVLSDKLFSQMDVPSIQTALRPKVDGSMNLDRVFSSSPPLDFFIMLSSTGSVIGTPGQSNYHMANTFMAGLAADRRRRGLAGSVIDVGMISDTGYVTRQDPIVAKKLRSMCVLALCEAEVHVMFAEGILAGRPGFASHGELVAGLAASENEAERPFWAPEPRFGFYVRDKHDVAGTGEGTGGSSVVEDLRAALGSATHEDEVLDKVREAFAQRLESLLQLPKGGAKTDLPLVSLGLDSLLAMEVQTWFRKIVGVEVSVLQILSGASGDAICRAASASAFANRSSAAPAEAQAKDEDKAKTTTHLSVPAIETKGTSTPITPDHRTTPGTPDASPPTPMTSVGSESRDEQVDGYFKERKIRRVVHRRAPMSLAQARLWFLQGFLADPTTYNETSAYELRGQMDVDKLRNAFRQVCWHHEILRTSFYTDPETGVPTQAVAATSSCPFRFVDGADEDTLEAEYEAMKTRQWDLEEGVVLGLTLLRHSPERHTLILSSHHIAIDGVTWILLLRDLARSYEGHPLPSVPQYVDFSLKQRALVESGRCAAEIQFWREELASLPDALPLFPMAHTKTRKATNQYATTIVETVLPLELVSKVKQTSSRLSVTPFHFYFAVLASLVSRLSQTGDFCIGAVDTGRGQGGEFAQTAGCFINIVPVRVGVAKTETFESLCNKSSAKILSSLGNAAVPLDALLDELQVPRTARHSPIFQVIINYRLGILGLDSIGEAELKYVRSRSSGNPYDLGVNITDAPDGTCLLHFAVQDALYSREAAQAILDCYRRLLESACQDPRSLVSDLEMHRSVSGVDAPLTGRGRRVQDDWFETISRQIDRIAEANPDLIALRDGKKTYTYREVMNRVDAIATALQQFQPASNDDGPFCCILFEPSADYVFSFLAVLKAGLTAVSLDTTNHEERLATIVDDCTPVAILHHQATRNLAASLQKPHTETQAIDITKCKFSGRSTNRSAPDAPGVLFYTSGTTGIPKGALLTQANYKNMVSASSRGLGVRQAAEVVLQQTGVGFDLCPFEIFTALSNAGTLIIASAESRRDPASVANIVRDEGVTFMSGTPIEFKHIFQHAPDTLKNCSALRTVVVGGEMFTPQLAKQFKQAMPRDTKVFNVYGPTETCIFSNFEDVEYRRDDLDVIPVGPVLDNVSVYVVDDAGNLAPDGCAGEVCIGGAGVSRGYLRRPDLTSASFTSDPFATPEDRSRGWTRMYRTGDSGYLRPDGSLVVLGRIAGDTQVKIRGIRIELADVAANILATAGGRLAEAVVTVRGDNKTLVGFAVPAPNSNAATLEECLDALPASLPLPEYMRPSIIIPLDKLPVTRSGKLDRNALDAIPIPARSPNGNSETLSALETELRRSWAAVLPDTLLPSADVIGPGSDFFRLGGNSLLLVTLRKAIRKQWGVSVPLLQLFEASTLRSMAAAIRGAKEAQGASPDWEFWDAETRFEASGEYAPMKPAELPSRDRVVLLTGATKGLGAWILKLLLSDDAVSEVHCVAVSPDQRDNLPLSERLVIHNGSLADPSLGLDTTTFNTLKSSVDLVIHAGAEGSCLNTYASIPQNLSSTKFLTNLALSRKIPLHYISSPRVVLFSGQTSYPERSVAAHFYPPPSLGREGFTSTKWASERYLEACAAATGLRMVIHRAGYLMSEDADELDAVNMIHKYSALLGAVPSLATFEGFLDMCSLPSVAAAVLRAFDSDEDGVIYGNVRFLHHTEDNVVPVQEFQQYMEKRFGHGFRSLSMEEWAEEAEGKGMSPVLSAFLEAVVQRGDEARYPRLLKGDGGGLE
ncbi:hybrid pks-nrps protein [Colletotrichum sojae]|uniref:Hybrid pks-nrps protein n=1 Tax=Colletotrichum sojae TaxID=2175907 RepID=A0A8H6J3R3_9PEZI|nr:hybrid pks-nrps protein [Colletotrichum sojae]